MIGSVEDAQQAYVAGLVRVRAAAGAVFADEAGRVLVVHPVYKEQWEIPGGMLERDESPLAACIREVEEELALSVPIGPMLCVDWVPPRPPWDGGLMFVFDGGVLSPAQVADIRLAPSELDQIAFVEPGELGTVLVPRLARRLEACLAAGRGGVYLEDGIGAAAG
jgi:8-oxo-dGTP pyrophosphatase MutT (NUDIX family)